MIKNIDHGNVIHYGADSLVIKIFADGISKPYCIKILKEEYPLPETLVQLDNEFEICSHSKCSSIRKAFSKEKKEDHSVIVLEFIEGTDLNKLMAEGQEDITQQFHLAVDIATSLAELHKENIFHRRIHPSNILVEKNTHKIFFIDFGLATTDSTIFNELTASVQDKPVEVLKYIAPEQTGRINRAIDNRADLYSLGVILYRLFTGLLPFENKEGLELIYAHIAKTPAEPHRLNTALPKVVSDIIMKLLSKNAEDRYQSASGVKFDLERCLQQLLEKNKIDPFPIATKDFSGKIVLSNKLYGREKEKKYILQLFDNCASGQKKTLLVSGYSGSGKSTLIEILKDPVVHKKGFFIKGKFDKISSDTPYSVFVQAFKELIQQILTGDDAYQLRWKKRIVDSIGNSGKILTHFIPGIENLIGKQPDIAGLQGIEAQNRFNYEFTRFIKTIADKDHPLVIFIDDMQWADASSLNLFKIIAENRDIEYAMLIGVYRKNEVNESHPLMKKVNELKEENVHIEELELKDLLFENIHTLVTSSLLTDQEDTSFLSDIIYTKTQGNAFYVWQFLKSIYEEGFLRFDYDSQRWQWKTDLIMQMNVSGNVVELMTAFVQKLPAETLDLLYTASSIGNRFDKRTLSVLKEMSEKKVETLLNVSVSEGLIIPSGSEYKFAHDRIQQAIYSLISDKEKSAMHLSNGKKLTAHYSQYEVEEKIFELANQWNLGADQISDNGEKLYLAKLNSVAGHRAMSSTAYPQAFQYFEKGIYLMDTKDWETHYDFLLQITTDAADAAYLSGEYKKVDILVQDILQHSRSLIDSVRGYEIDIKKLIAQNKLIEAIKLGLLILQKLGISLPMKPGKLSVLKDLLKTKWLLRKKPMDYFNSLPVMKDEQKNAAMRIMSEISSASYFASPNLVPLLVFKMVNLTVNHGLSPKSPFSFAAYGFILSAHLHEIDKGSRMGEIALHLAKKINAEEVMGSIIATSNLFLDHWKKPLSELKTDLEKAFRVALEFGDNEWATYAAHNMVYQLFITGTQLQALAKKAESLDLQIEKFKQDLTLKRLRLFRQAIDNLQYEKEYPHLLSGNIYDESVMNITDVTKENEVYFQNQYILKLYLALIFNNTDNAKKYIGNAQRFQETVKGTALEPLFYFLRSLTIADVSINSPVKRTILRQVKKDINSLRKFEKISPQYIGHKSYLLHAEYHYLKGEMESAKIYYDKALTMATENGMMNDLAFFWERAGQFFLNTKQDLLANFYLQNAYRTYKRWGAEAKVKQMDLRYIHLNSDSGTDWHQESLPNRTKESAGNLDLETVMKASSALSGEIVLPRLLKKMMQIIMQNAGAQTGFLIMEKKGEPFIEAEIDEDKEEIKILQSVPVRQTGLLAESIVNYVYQTQETIILDDAGKSQLFGNDEFIKQHECKSVLCVPLINMGKTQAIVYLTNDLTFGAFTENRVALLKLLAGQMAVSIENALFYTELENKVNERTNELNIEKKKSDDLLLNILPEEIAEELKQTGHTIPRSYEIATVMFTDFENFTSKSEKLSPEELVNVIDTCFKKFDEIISRHKIEKIKTIGDAYLCVSGLPDAKDHDAENVVIAALEIIESIKELQNNSDDEMYFNIRVGIHTGPLVAGVVGDKKFAYDIWGDTVNTAARMEQNSEPDKINISQSTYDLIKHRFNCTFRGKKAAKNKGMIEMYFVENIK